MNVLRHQVYIALLLDALQLRDVKTADLLPKVNVVPGAFDYSTGIVSTFHVNSPDGQQALCGYGGNGFGRDFLAGDEGDNVSPVCVNCLRVHLAQRRKS